MLQLQLFLRDNSTGKLSASFAVKVGTYTSSGPGKITDLVVSKAKGHVVLGMSSRILVVLDIEVRFTKPNPTFSASLVPNWKSSRL